MQQTEETDKNQQHARTDKSLNGDHRGAFVKGQTNISRASNCNRLLLTYLFRICGPLLFHLRLLIHNNKLN